jgi:cyclic beta-1,2-glucan synthetase
MRTPPSCPSTDGLGQRGLAIRVFAAPTRPIPEVQLLSNGRYHVMVTNAGGGYSRWKDLAVTRWREDRTCDNWGTFCYLRDVDSGEFWSTAYQPTLKQDRSAMKHLLGRAGRVPRAATTNYDTHTEIAVSPEDDIELRRVRITNRARTRRTIDRDQLRRSGSGSAGLGRPASGVQQPFVQTEIIPGSRRSSAPPAPLPGAKSRPGCCT